MKIRWLLVICPLLAVVVLSANTENFKSFKDECSLISRVEDSYQYITKYSQKDGFPEVDKALFQDYEGYIWLKKNPDADDENFARYYKFDGIHVQDVTFQISDYSVKGLTLSKIDYEYQDTLKYVAKIDESSYLQFYNDRFEIKADERYGFHKAEHPIPISKTINNRLYFREKDYICRIDFSKFTNRNLNDCVEKVHFPNDIKFEVDSLGVACAVSDDAYFVWDEEIRKYSLTHPVGKYLQLLDFSEDKITYSHRSESDSLEILNVESGKITQKNSANGSFDKYFILPEYNTIVLIKTLYETDDENYYCKYWLLDKDNLQIKNKDDLLSSLGVNQIYDFCTAENSLFILAKEKESSGPTIFQYCQGQLKAIKEVPYKSFPKIDSTKELITTAVINSHITRKIGSLSIGSNINSSYELLIAQNNYLITNLGVIKQLAYKSFDEFSFVSELENTSYIGTKYLDESKLIIFPHQEEIKLMQTFGKISLCFTNRAFYKIKNSNNTIRMLDDKVIESILSNDKGLFSIDNNSYIAFHPCEKLNLREHESFKNFIDSINVTFPKTSKRFIEISEESFLLVDTLSFSIDSIYPKQIAKENLLKLSKYVFELEEKGNFELKFDEKRQTYLINTDTDSLVTDFKDSNHLLALAISKLNYRQIFVISVQKTDLPTNIYDVIENKYCFKPWLSGFCGNYIESFDDLVFYTTFNNEFRLNVVSVDSLAYLDKIKDKVKSYRLSQKSFDPSFASDGENVFIYGNQNFIYRFKNDEIKSFKIKGEVLSSCKDSEGNLWFSTSNSLLKYNSQSKEFLQYDSYYGVPTNITSIHSYNKQIAIASNNGLFLFDEPEQDYKFLNFSFVQDGNVFKDLEASNENTIDRYVYVSNKKTIIRIKSNSFYSDKNIKYSIFLQGYDTDWPKFNNNAEREFGILKPGRYSVQARIKLDNGEIIETDIYPFRVSRLGPQIVIIVIYVILLLTAIVLIVRAFFVRRVKKINRDKKRLASLVDQQTLEIVNKQKSLHSSITYAATLQKSILPSDKEVCNFVKEYFSIYLPKDRVSGDFIWFYQIDKDRAICAVVDCTGHGVPGALLTIAANSIMNNVLKDSKFSSINECLEEIDNRIRNLVRDKDTGLKAGLDLGIVLIDKTIKEIEFIGARCNMFVRKDNEELQVVKGTKRSIGDTKDIPFEAFQLSYDNQIELYLSTDGIYDMAVIEDGARKRFKQKGLIDFINQHRNISLATAKDVLSKTISDCHSQHSQRDDITVVGIRI